MNKFEKRIEKLKKEKENCIKTLTNFIDGPDPELDQIKYDLYRELDDVLKELIKEFVHKKLKIGG